MLLRQFRLQAENGYIVRSPQGIIFQFAKRANLYRNANLKKIIYVNLLQVLYGRGSVVKRLKCLYVFLRYCYLRIPKRINIILHKHQAWLLCLLLYFDYF